MLFCHTRQWIQQLELTFVKYPVSKFLISGLTRGAFETSRHDIRQQRPTSGPPAAPVEQTMTVSGLPLIYIDIYIYIYLAI